MTETYWIIWDSATKTAIGGTFRGDGYWALVCPAKSLRTAMVFTTYRKAEKAFNKLYAPYTEGITDTYKSLAIRAIEMTVL